MGYTYHAERALCERRSVTCEELISAADDQSTTFMRVLRDSHNSEIRLQKFSRDSPDAQLSFYDSSSQYVARWRVPKM
ncbi:hypothetical protein KIN20_024634 [Parelaphostrongylus tenuis]|uniref:Uncharacterized protein n=1 Tax=Parelaphostrongylus tenuis TaxID=148309 RepID=A0AAD5QTS3_PARTN|nr:hypothetical protein KIN20_024634 [Parelaphostrongylus tenuis]